MNQIYTQSVSLRICIVAYLQLITSLAWKYIESVVQKTFWIHCAFHVFVQFPFFKKILYIIHKCIHY